MSDVVERPAEGIVVLHATMDADPGGALVDVVIDHGPTEARVLAHLVGRLSLDYSTSATVITIDRGTRSMSPARARNTAASYGRAPLIAFFSPYLRPTGEWVSRLAILADQSPVIITPSEHPVPNRRPDEVRAAALIVDREWFFRSGRFDERFQHSHEARDLARRAHHQNRPVIGAPLPLGPIPQDVEDETDALIYRSIWGLR